MKPLFTSSLAISLLLGVGLAAEPSVVLQTRSRLNSRVANIHVDYDRNVEGGVTFTYGSCHSKSQQDSDHVVSRSDDTAQSHRLVWVIPRDSQSGGCLSAWGESGELLGRSAPQELSELNGNSKTKSSGEWAKRGDESIHMGPENGIDVWGPWFDGVALLENKKHKNVDVEAAKRKEVAIVGAGMSGLMTYLILHQAGLKNIEILEGSGRLGGRVRTEYLSGGPKDYAYQEMGPMRIPYTKTIGNSTYNITDQQILFQVAHELNHLNSKKHPELNVDFIPFYMFSDNALVYYKGRKMDNGLPPTQGDVAQDPSLGAPQPEIPESAEILSEKLTASLPGDEFMVEIANNIFQAHADFLKNKGPGGLPGDQWSEFGYLVNYLNATVTDANALTGGIDQNSYLTKIYHTLLFGPGITMKTIDGGMNRLPQAFGPLVEDVTQFNTKVERIQWDEETERLTIQWRGNYTEPTLESKEYDFAVMAAPLKVVQRMRLPDLPFAMRNAINTMLYSSACKVALEYKTRFWEHFERPIYGSCDTLTDIPGLGSICYPSFGINGTGPGCILATYEPDPPLGVEWVSVPEEQHVQYVIDAMVEIHGEVAREQYTGNYRRKCWVMDEFASAAWAEPSVGAHETYLPQFFTTHKNMIFVGEHSSITHAWIASALESGIRGGVQLLLELGLVDEAQDAVDKWMARWISV